MECGIINRSLNDMDCVGDLRTLTEQLVNWFSHFVAVSGTGSWFEALSLPSLCPSALFHALPSS